MSNLAVSFQEIASGVWTAMIGDKTSGAESLTAFAGVRPKLAAINAIDLMAPAGFPFADPVVSYKIDSKLILCLPLAETETLYGGGLHYQKSSIKGSVFHLKTDHYSGRDDGRTHVPVPFYISDQGYGVFINTSHYVDLYMGTANRTNSRKGFQDTDRNTDPDWQAQPVGEYVEAAINQAAGAEVVVFAGYSMLEVVQRFNLYCGGGYIPPKWGLGVWKRVPALYSAQDVIDNINEFAKRQFPLDVVGLEPGWQSRSYPCTYEWDAGRFPDPASFVRQTLALGVKLNLWENAYISPQAKIFAAMLPFSGSHTVWGGIVPDYSMEQAVQILQKQHWENHVDLGISGYKLDECDGFDQWLWPDHAEFPSGHTAEQLRTTYGLLLQKATYQIFREANQRTYGLTRASNGGSSSFPYVIYNDCYSFDEFLVGLCNSGYVGTLWVPEVRDAADSNEWLRRCQLVCFSPMAMVNSWASAIEPWSFADVAGQVQDVFTLRKRLLPYLYSAYARYCFEGIPPFRSMALDSGCSTGQQTGGELDATRNPYASRYEKSILDQFMMGDDLLIAPIAPHQERREVVLPAGDWFDFYTGEKAGNNTTILVDGRQEKIPIYVRDGGLIPLLDLNQAGRLEVNYYGGKDSRFVLFDDDGESFAYEQGQYDLTELSAVRGADGRPVFTARLLKDGLAAKNYRNISFTEMGKL